MPEAASKKKQPLLTDVEKTEMDKKIESVIEAYKELQEAKAEMADRKAELMPLMKKSKRFEIKANGFKIRYRDKEEGVSVSKESNKE